LVEARFGRPDEGQRILLNKDIACIWLKIVCAACRAAFSSLYWPMASA